MGRIYNPFSSHRRDEANSEQTSGQNQSSNPTAPTAPRNRHAPHVSVATAPDRLDDIRDYVRGASTYVQWLQGLSENERSNVAQVNEIKRELKTAHRSLERLHAEKCRGVGDEIEALVKDATRHAWRSYRNVVKLEEKLRALTKGETGETRVHKNIDNHERRGRSRVKDGEQKVHASNGFIDTRRVSQTPPGMRTQYIESDEDEETFVMSGALPSEDQPATNAVQKVGRADALDVLRELPHVLARGAPSQVTSLHAQETNPEKIPQPRDEVKRRIQNEGENQEITLRDPDRVRRGSCNGFMITEMTIKGVDDPRFVLPYLHYMKIHELRYLKEWLANAGYINSSGTITRMEKCLLCIQLLQTGCRYEALAVIHSRSPLQVNEACKEVMQGLLHWHRKTVDDDQIGDQAKYIGLWDIWEKFVVSDGRAALYYGIDWTSLAKVLVALNIYMGRWRMQGKFAMDGPAFVWGKFFVPKSNDQASDRVDGVGKEGRIDQDDKSSIVTNPYIYEAPWGMATANPDG
jgi:hypothetical protein